MNNVRNNFINFIMILIFLFIVAGDNHKYTETKNRRASVCSLDSGTSLSFLSSNGTRTSDNNNNSKKLILAPSSPMASARSTEV